MPEPKKIRREADPALRKTAVAHMEEVKSEHARRVFTGYEDIIKRFGADSDAERLYRFARPVQTAIAREPKLHTAMNQLRRAYQYI